MKNENWTIKKIPEKQKQIEEQQQQHTEQK